ncbi:MAG: PEP-CTERM sorting domain-containing protein [Casimicrobiaceae bacterium]
MTSMNFRRTVVGAAVATALGVLAEPATAAPYQGVFDPVDFSGQYIINVNPTCLLTSGWHANAGICAATLLSAYADVVSSAPEGPNYTGRLTFAPPAISSSLQLFGIYVYGGQIDSFDTAPLPQQGESPSTPDNWFLKFTSGQAPCSYPPCIGPDGALPFDPTLKGVYLSANFLGIIASAQYIGRAVDIGGIPEPGTLSLLLGAIGGGWLARRRRKEKVPDPN